MASRDSDPNGEQRDEDDDVLETDAEALETEIVGPVSERPLPIPGGRDKALSRHDPLAAYMADVNRYPLLSPEEQNRLAIAFVESGDVNAAAALVTANLRLVVKIAFEYRRAYKNILDLIQEGNVGLMQAVRKYDPYRGVKLSSYAAWWIRAYILRFILNNWQLVRIGTTEAQRKLFFNLSKEKARLSALGIEPTPDEIAKRLDVTHEDVVQMDRRMSGGEVSLDAPVGNGDGKSIARVDLMPSEGDHFDDDLAKNEIDRILHAKIEEFGQTLTGKEAIIFRERLLAEEPLTLQEIGERFDVSRERVRQIEKRLQEKLRTYLQANVDRAILDV